MRKWDKQKIIEAIRERQQRGLSLSTVWKDDISLYAAAKHHFHGWQNAMSAVGLAGELEGQWTRQRVVAAIKARRERGESMASTYHRENSLFVAACQLFGGWPDALQAAGLDGNHQRRWSRERIIKELRVLHRSSSTNIKRHDTALWGAARRYFGSLDAARLAAGQERPVKKWSTCRVVEAIQDRHVRGVSIQRADWKGDRSLANAANKYFGNWNNALKAAGLDHLVAHQMPKREWTKEAVIEAIQNRNRLGLPIHGIRHDDGSLFHGANKHFGCWSEALSAAGFQPIVRRTWSAERVLEEIRTRQRNGLSLKNVGNHDGALVHAAHKYFGSWREALTAASQEQPQQPVLRKAWNKQRVLDEILAQHDAGIPMTRRHNQSLAGPARYYFGSWNAAVLAAGLKPTRRPPWTRQCVINAIRERQQQGLPLTNVCKHHPTLSTAALRFFYSWDDAMKAAGLAPRVRWSKQRVTEALLQRYNEGNLATTWKDDPELYRAAARQFGCWGHALRAADLPPPRRTWSRERVIIELRAWHRHRAGTSVSRADLALGAAARKYFGSLKNAFAEASIEPPIRRWSRRLVVEKIQDRVVQGRRPRARSHEDHSLFYAVQRYFGDWDEALAAAGVVRSEARP